MGKGANCADRDWPRRLRTNGFYLSANFETMFAFRIVTGVGSGMLPPNSGGVISDLVSPKNRGKYFGRMIGISIIGAALGAPAGAVFIQMGGWQGAFIGFGALAAINPDTSVEMVPQNQINSGTRSVSSGVKTGSVQNLLCGSSSQLMYPKNGIYRCSPATSQPI
ncbi:MAG: hypothetical protein Ct9H300mP11_31320 [Chloroflexota bacterium]|nr:MAG: hypothetical protein Ct9H300mP11_31320 [Chloroflexota bacterium]